MSETRGWREEASDLLEGKSLRRWWENLQHLHPGAVLARGKKHPPGPVPNSWMGNLDAIQEDPLVFLMGNAERYGDIFRYRVGVWNVVMLRHPAYVKHVLQDRARIYTKANLDYATLKWVLGEGLLTSEGEHWKRQRRMIQPLFHRDRLAEMSDIMVGCAVERVEHWRKQKTSTTTLDSEMMSLTLQIVGKTLFSLDLLKEAHAVGEAFGYINAFFGKVDPMAALLPPLPFGKRILLQNAVKTLDQVVLSILRERRNAPRATGEKKDLVDLLLGARDEETGEGMSDDQIRDELVTMILAGHETTALALTWTIALLSQHPSVERRLVQEIRECLGDRPPTMADLASLPYARQVIEEGMRLYPPAWAITRLAAEDDQIAGYDIPARSIVVMSSYVTHRHPEFWPNPLGFDPERFSEQAAQGRHRFAYFPFGGGQRLCIGRSFALMEAHLALVTLLQAYRIDLAPHVSLAASPQITLHPKEPLTVHLTPRAR